ncbi:MAG: hypothetical protein J0M10_03845 [Chitinophagales bacterium]|nr:hypothetical protein [Chitinophagales bacterium]
MKEILRRQFKQYIKEHNPDLLAVLNEAGRLEEFLEENLLSVDELLDRLGEKQVLPARILEQCLEELTRPLRPSRYHYCEELLKTQFPGWYQQIIKDGLVQLELIGFISQADSLFDELHFSEQSRDLPLIRYAVTGYMYEFMKNKNNGH